MSEQTNSSKGVWGIIIIVGIIGLQFLLRQDRNENRQHLNLDENTIAAITITPGYTSCPDAEFPLACDSIYKIWDIYRKEESDPLEKAQMLSIFQLAKFKSNMKDALHLDKEGLLKLDFPDQIRIVQNRMMLLELHTIQELREMEDQEIYAEALYVTVGSEPTKNKLAKIKFTSPNNAYGIYPIFGQEKSVNFTKDADNWKINIYKEDPYFDDQRARLEKTMLSSYASPEDYLVKVFGDEKYLNKLKI